MLYNYRRKYKIELKGSIFYGTKGLTMCGVFGKIFTHNLWRDYERNYYTCLYRVQKQKLQHTKEQEKYSRQAYREKEL